MSSKETTENINIANQPAGVPMPIVKLNRWILLVGIILALIIQQPLIITLLFLILLPPLIIGQRWSPVGMVGKLIFAQKIPSAEREDLRLSKFNNTIAAGLLFLAQLAFLFGAPVLGWVLSLLVALAAAIALMGYCVGCFLYFQYNQLRFRLLGRR